MLAEVVDAKPLGLHPKIELERLAEGPFDSNSTATESTAVLVKPLLMNRGDAMTIKMLITDIHDGDLVLDGRVVGIEEFKEGPWSRLHATPLLLPLYYSVGLALMNARGVKPAKDLLSAVTALSLILPYFMFPVLLHVFRRSRFNWGRHSWRPKAERTVAD